MTMFKLGFVIIILIVAVTINVPEFSNNQVVAASDIDHVLSEFTKRLLPQLNTCFRSCTSDSDCSDCWICCTCRNTMLGHICDSQ
ncbi:hypothetical protein A4A49_64931 [Nicotiana attenuata]|uniref:Carboxypeptidase A inhibitor-like domain-containing protein n=1 Tax=Nicotiana attenuata TaxID=49451 RepID=A0A1J6KE82_NICAT|nr:hypothetical protein A4A49_64931 [Nicotiana attenuata]